MPMRSPHDHCPSLSPLFPWLQDPLLASPPRPLTPFQSPCPAFHVAIAFASHCSPHSLWPHRHPEATRRLTWKIPHTCVPSRFLLEALAVSQPHLEHVRLCTLTFALQLLLPRGPPPQIETLPLASKVRLGPALLLAPGGSMLWMDFAPTCLHLVLSTCPALPWSRCLPLHQENGKASRIPPRPAPPHPLSVLQPEWAVQNKMQPRPENQPAGPAWWALLCPPASSFPPPPSLLPLHPSPTSLLLWVYLSHCSFQLRHTQSCFHHLKSCSCPFSHG